MITSKILRFLGTAVLVIGFSATAHAQATRTWVSGVGDDANPCSRTAPCKTFAGAISKTASGGEINVLDPGGFGAVTITKPITISSEGFEAGVLTNAGSGIIVNVPNAADVVVLRGLDFEGLSAATNGIIVITGGTVQVENCTINHFTQNGINFAPTVANSQLRVVNTIARSNNGAGGAGLSVSSGNLVNVMVSNSSFVGNTIGILAIRNSRVSIFECTISGNAQQGVLSRGQNGVSVANLGKCEIANNGAAGVQAGDALSNQQAFVRITDCNIHQNTGTGALVSTNGEVDTFQDNHILANGADGCPSCTNKPSN